MASLATAVNAITTTVENIVEKTTKTLLIELFEDFATKYLASTDHDKSELVSGLMQKLDDLVQKQKSTAATAGVSTEVSTETPPDAKFAEEEKSLPTSKSPFEYIVFSGGGIRGFSFLGALVLLLHKYPSLLNECKGFAGTSIGAFLAFLNVLSLSPFEIDDYMSTVNGNMLQYLNFQRFRDFGGWFNNSSGTNSGGNVSNSNLNSNSSSTSSPSIITSNALQTLIVGAYQYADHKDVFNRCVFSTFGRAEIKDHELKLTRQVFASRIMTKQYSQLTFAELYSLTRRELAIVVTNMSTKRMEIHSYKTTPEFNVMSSLIASMSIPLVFPAININGNFYVDGGIVNNFPIAKLWPLEQTLGFCLCSSTANDLIYEHYMAPHVNAYPDIFNQLSAVAQQMPKVIPSSAVALTTNVNTSNNITTNTINLETKTTEYSFFDQIKSIFKSFQTREPETIQQNKSIGLVDEITGFTGIMFDQLQYNNITALDQQYVMSNIVFIDTKTCPTFSFATTALQKQELIECGFKSAFLWLRANEKATQESKT